MSDECPQLKIYFLTKKNEAILLLGITLLVSTLFFLKEMINIYYIILSFFVLFFFIMIKYVNFKIKTEIYIYGQLETYVNYNSKHFERNEKIFKITLLIDDYINRFRKSSYIPLFSFSFLILGITLNLSSMALDLNIQHRQLECIFNMHTTDLIKDEFFECISSIDPFKHFQVLMGSIFLFAVSSVLALYKK